MTLTYIRALKLSDVDRMLEWMNDPEVVERLLIGRYPVARDTVEAFIRKSWTDRENLHFAIADDQDTYLGTISLKHINHIDRNAEYAIALSKDAWGKSHAAEASRMILQYGFEKLNLYKIYLNVIGNNIRANRFYEKIGFLKEACFKRHVYINGGFEDLIWYCVFRQSENHGGSET